MTHVSYSVPRRGFTLVELLVVIAIIGLLIALLLPAMTNARAYGNTVLCGTRQKGIYTALMTYEGDFKTLPAYGSVGNLAFTDTVNPYTDPFGGSVVWGTLPAGAQGLALGAGNSTTAGPIGIGMAIQGNYMPLELVFCPEYTSIYDVGNRDQAQTGDLTGRTKNWHMRKFLWGAPFCNSDAAVNALPGSDGFGMPVGGGANTGAYLGCQIAYRAGDWSYTTTLTSTVGVPNASPEFSKSQHAQFPNHALLADNRNWYHLRGMSGSNVTWGDGSVTFKQNTAFGTASSFSLCFSGSASSTHYVAVPGVTNGATRTSQNSVLPMAWFDKLDQLGR